MKVTVTSEHVQIFQPWDWHTVWVNESGRNGTPTHVDVVVTFGDVEVHRERHLFLKDEDEAADETLANLGHKLAALLKD